MNTRDFHRIYVGFDFRMQTWLREHIMEDDYKWELITYQDESCSECLALRHEADVIMFRLVFGICG